MAHLLGVIDLAAVKVKLRRGHFIPFHRVLLAARVLWAIKTCVAAVEVIPPSSRTKAVQ